MEFGCPVSLAEQSTDFLKGDLRASFFATIQPVIATELKTGKIFQEDGVPFQVLRYEHIKSARGGANVKVKARNLLNGSVLEKGYMATARVEDASITKADAQYLYKDNSGLIFMNPTTYEQFTISKDLIGDAADFLKDGEVVLVMYFEEMPIAVELPKIISFKISYTEPGFKGNTVTNTYKDATLENGTVIKVPTFIKIGDTIKINTEMGEYVSKA